MKADRPKHDPKTVRAAFRMPSVQTMMSRKSSITNAFVNSLVPVIEPTIEEIVEALEILGIQADDVRCAYCGDPYTEWDHLRPLVLGRRPTGYISEIGNLVPSCGKCNQSKRNENWEAWMVSDVPRSPASRRVPDLEKKIERLRAYERWRPVEPVDFKAILGEEKYREYWQRLDNAIDYMRECQTFAEILRKSIADAHSISRKKDAAG